MRSDGGSLQHRNAVAHQLVLPRGHRDLRLHRLLAEGGLAPLPAREGELRQAPPDPKASVVETLTKEEIDALLGAV